MATEHILVFEGEFPSFTRIGMVGIVGDAESDLAGREVGKIILNGFIDDLSGFDGAAKAFEWNRVGGDEREVRSDLFDFAT